jgi:hypothetical protein
MHPSQLLSLCCAAVLLTAPAARAQVEVPKPGPEHERLKHLVGTWDATVKTAEGESKGTMTYKSELGGLWLIGEFQADFGGQKFQGRSTDGYDPAKKKYIGVWVDSWTTTPMLSEGTFDKDGKVLTMIGEGPGMDGKPTKYKSVTELKDKDTMVFTMSAPGKDGKDQTVMTITYKRKK